MASKIDHRASTIDRILEWRGLFIFNTILLAALMVLAFWVSWRNLEFIKVIAGDNFNQQQLILARQVAGEIESAVVEIRNSLRFESASPDGQHQSSAVIRGQLAAIYNRLSANSVSDIYCLLPSGAVLLSNSNGVAVGNIEEFRRRGYFARMDEASEPGYVVGAAGAGGLEDRFLEIGSFVESADGRRYFLIARADVLRMIRSIARDVRSGETGYCWIIDARARFLYHPNEDFIGRNALEARRERMPDISFGEINQLQNRKMLEGEEGTSRYVSGWHGDVKGEMEKLIAFSPIRIENTGWIWSAAVVAPVSEVQAVINRMYLRQTVLEGLLIVGIFIISFMAFAYKRKLSNALREELLRAERSLHQTEEYYRSIFESAQDPIYLVNEDLQFTSMNVYTAKVLRHTVASRTGWAEIATFGPEQFIGMKIGDILAERDAEFLETKASKVFLKKLPDTFEHHFRVGDRQIHFNTRFIPIFGEEGSKVSSVLGISRDITEKKEMEYLIYNTEKLASLGTLAAGVAHEINNPLGVILGFTDLMLDRTEKESQSYEDLKIIEENCINCKRIVENLMSFARVTEGVEEVVDLNNAIKTVARIVRSTLVTTKIELRLKVDENLPGVMGDTREIQQVLFNLINNAVYAMREYGGELLIETEAFPLAVEVRVIDQGTGIPKHIGNSLFDPFFTTKDVGEGTGLGLSVSYGILRKYGGSIRYTSVALGEAEEGEETGTTFYVTLPIYEPSQAGEAGEAGDAGG